MGLLPAGSRSTLHLFIDLIYKSWEPGLGNNESSIFSFIQRSKPALIGRDGSEEWNRRWGEEPFLI